MLPWIAATRIGVEGDLHFWGGSFVARPDGTLAAEAGTSEEILVVDCDLGQVDEAREGWPFFRDRRIDAYAGLSKRFGDAPASRRSGRDDDPS